MKTDCLKKVGLLLSILAFASFVNAQNLGVNTTGATPSTNAILDLNTGNAYTLGLIVPHVQLTTSLTTFSPPMAGPPTTLDTALMVYNTNAAAGTGVGYYYWTGSLWVNVSGVPTGWQLIGSGGVTASTAAIGSAANNNFVGTTNATDYVLAADGFERLRIANASGYIGINNVTPGAQLDVQGLTGTGPIFNTTGNSVTGNNVAQISGTGLTSGNGLLIQGPTAGGTLTGNLLQVATASTGAATNGFVRYSFSGAHTGNGIQLDDATTAGTAMQINANSLIGGTGLAVTGTNATLTGNLFLTQSASTAAAANGLARFNFTGAHSGNGIQLDDATTAGTAMKINANALVGGTGLAVTGTNTTLTGNLLLTQSASTAAAANGFARFNFTAAHTGNGIQVDDATALGNAVAINASGLSSGAALSIAPTSTTGANGLSSYAINILSSGVNTGTIHTAYGLYSSVINTGTTATNVAGYFSASGGSTANYAIVVPSAGGTVGIGNTAPNASAELDLTNTNNKGFLPPSVGLSATNSISPFVAATTPANGLMVYNTATAGTAPNNVVANNYYYYNTATSRWIMLAPLPNYSSNIVYPVTNDAAPNNQVTAGSWTTSGTNLSLAAAQVTGSSLTIATEGVYLITATAEVFSSGDNYEIEIAMEDVTNTLYYGSSVPFVQSWVAWSTSTVITITAATTYEIKADSRQASKTTYIRNARITAIRVQ